MNKIFLSLLLTFISCLCAFSNSKQYPKREFRGAWIQCVNGQYLGKSMSEIRSMLSSQLDVLGKVGINAIIFQVRAEGDALYASKYEPWSRYLTGRQGVAPSDGWDPLDWMINECHKRGMECHAWINPYRAKTKGTTELAPNNPVLQFPERVFRYGDLIIFNPALEINRTYTCMIIDDIISRYDVDGLHMDDYFYPYPENGIEIPDMDYYKKNPRGFHNIDDWRRDNVSMLIHDIHKLIRAKKPWVKFGISPFGIYRNNKDGVNTKEGSATNGLQNYDQLYADIVLWQEKGWVDYLIPQIYWNVGTKAADYKVLCDWWNDYCSKRPLYIGQDVERTVKEADPNNPQTHQMALKYNIQRSEPNVQGSCQWYAAAVVNNPGGYRTMLEQNYHKYPALQPLMPFIDSKVPKSPQKPSIIYEQGKIYLTWNAPKYKKELDRATKFVVYRYANSEKIKAKSLDATHIVGITSDTRYLIEGNQHGYTYVVTSLDRINNESKPIKIKL